MTAQRRTSKRFLRVHDSGRVFFANLVFLLISALLPSEAGDHWRKHLCTLFKHRDIRDPILLPSFLENITNLIERTDETMGKRRHVLLCGFKSSCKLLQCVRTLLCHNHSEDNDIEFQPLEALTCCLVNPAYLLHGCCWCGISDIQPTSISQGFRCDAHYRGFPCRKGQQVLSSTANKKRRGRTLNGLGEAVQIGESVGIPREACWFLCKEPLHHPNSLFQAANAHGCRVIDDPTLLILSPIISSTETKLEPPIGKEIQCGRLLREHHRMSKVIVKDVTSYPQRPCCFSRCENGRDRSKLLPWMIWNNQYRVS